MQILLIQTLVPNMKLAQKDKYLKKLKNQSIKIYSQHNPLQGCHKKELGSISIMEPLETIKNNKRA